MSLTHTSAFADPQGRDASPQTATTIDFIKTIFAHTVEPVYLCSFANERHDETQASERHITTRMPGHITSFLEKWDKPGRGLFFCVGTVKGGDKRNKANIVETPCLFTDLDPDKIDGLPRDNSAVRIEMLHQLTRLKYQPSIIVWSGSGLHCYWLFKEPVDTQANAERIEALLRQLADVVAGDLPVCEISRVLRLPGSHNTKRGEWNPVEIIELHPERRYEMDDLEEWLAEQSPVMLRKTRELAVPAGETDFFAEYAKLHGIKAPIDVEKRLEQMLYMGGEECSIHQTQLVVTAALLNRGMPVDDVVEIVLDATRRAAGAYGGRWNWRREGRKLRGMCESWIKKHPPEERKPKSALKSIEGGVVEMRSETLKDEEKQTEPPSNIVPMPPPKLPNFIKNEEQHVTLGEAVLAHMRANGEQMINTEDGAWHYSRGIWELRIEQRWLNVRIERTCRGLGFKSGTKLTNETRNWIERNPDIWREGDLPWDQHGKIPTRSGLIDPKTGQLEPACAEHFCTWRVEVDYDPAAKCPWWETMIEDVFGDRNAIEQAALVRVIQECFGTALIDKKPRALSKALVLWGNQNLGKSGPLDVVAGLFGKSTSSTIGSVDSTHGLMPFVKRAPWVLHEAFNPGQWHISSTVKSIITHEPVSINIKNGPVLTQIVRSPIFWATNGQPQFKEATRAIVSRMIVVEVSRAFDEAVPIGAAAEALRRGFAKPGEFVIATELPGVLNWAIAGLRRALERGSIELTAGIKEVANAIHRDSNLVAGFLEECVGFDPMARVRVADFCLAHSAWFVEMKGEDRRLPSNDSIGKALKAMGDARIGMDVKEMRDNTSRFYCGIALNRAGLRYHRTAFESNLFEGKIATATNPDREVNSFIPAGWDTKPSIIEMRKRHPQPQLLENTTKSAIKPDLAEIIGDTDDDE
jgi:P4 family phage/plasmid primase-like protien